jgi:hypothetical protein
VSWRCIPFVPIGAPPLQLGRVVDIGLGKAKPVAITRYLLHPAKVPGIKDAVHVFPIDPSPSRHKNVPSCRLGSDEILHFAISDGVRDNEKLDPLLTALSEFASIVPLALEKRVIVSVEVSDLPVVLFTVMFKSHF